MFIAVDPVSHCLLGRSLNCLDAKKRLGRGAAAAFVLGSLAPDIDGALVARGWDVYLHYHATGTHTVAAAPLLAAATAALVRVLVRGSAWTRLFVAALIGVIAGHLAFDLVSGSDMRLFAPLSFGVFGPHLISMADVTAIAVLLAGTAISLRRRVAGGLVVAAGLAALLAVKAVSLSMAARVYERAAGPVSLVARPDAINGSLVRWRYYDRVNDTARAWTVDAWRRRATVDFTRDVREDPLAARTKTLPAILRLFGFAEIPFARVEPADAGRRVWWSDLKYCDAAECVMSFGAILDERGTPVRELVRIGGFLQTRPIAER